MLSAASAAVHVLLPLGGRCRCLGGYSPGGSAAITYEDVSGAASPEELPDRIPQMIANAGAAVPGGSHLPKGSEPAAIGLAVSGMTGLADKRAATRLGRNVYEVTAWSYALWGRPFGQERDLRAGSDANAQHKGQISRDLLRELNEAMEAE